MMRPHRFRFCSPQVGVAPGEALWRAAYRASLNFCGRSTSSGRKNGYQSNPSRIALRRKIEAAEASAREGAAGRDPPRANRERAVASGIFRRQVDGANSLISRDVTVPDTKPSGNGPVSISALADTGVACGITKLVAGTGPGHWPSTVGGSPGFLGRVNLVGATAAMGR